MPANREALTTVTLGDDQTLVIGGLIQEDESRNETTVPILGQILYVNVAGSGTEVDDDQSDVVRVGDV